MDDVKEYVLDQVTREARLDERPNSSQSFDDIGIDSLDMMNLLSNVEDRFKMSLNYKEAKKLEKVDDLIEVINKEIKTKQSL